MAQASSAVPITNTLFPPPPGYFKAFTPEAVARLAALRRGDSGEGEEVAPAEEGEEDELARALDPPRADWVIEEGHWNLFGQEYKALPHILNARDLNFDPLVADPVSAGGDAERETLPVLLHSFLHTLLALLDVLTGTARMPDELSMAGRASQGDQYIQHLSNLAATMMVSANQLRGVQAEATLVMLMEKQLTERREQTERLRAKSREVAATIRRLKESSGAAVSGASGSAGVDGKTAPLALDMPPGKGVASAPSATTGSDVPAAAPETAAGSLSAPTGQGATADATAIGPEPAAAEADAAPPTADAADAGDGDIAMLES